MTLCVHFFQDILNNLDSCDLEDDDLMLDADFAEDASLHSGTLDAVTDPSGVFNEPWCASEKQPFTMNVNQAELHVITKEFRTHQEPESKVI